MRKIRTLNVSISTGTVVDDVSLGFSCMLTNVTNLRSQINRHALDEKTAIRCGATAGASVTVVCANELGRYHFIAMVARVVCSVPEYSVMIGIPARQMGWMGRQGHPPGMTHSSGINFCPETGCRYQETEPCVLHCLDLDREAPLPKEPATGARPCHDFKGGRAREQAANS